MKRIADLLGLRGEPDPLFGDFDDRIQKHFGCDLRSLTLQATPLLLWAAAKTGVRTT